MAVYSKKIKNINDLKDGDSVLIPNDPTNGGRALILLDKAGVIKLKDNKKDKDSPYVNIVTVLKGRESEEKIQKLIKALQSEKVKKYIDEKYNGSVVAAF